MTKSSITSFWLCKYDHNLCLFVCNVPTMYVYKHYVQCQLIQLCFQNLHFLVVFSSRCANAGNGGIIILILRASTSEALLAFCFVDFDLGMSLWRGNPSSRHISTTLQITVSFLLNSKFSGQSYVQCAPRTSGSGFKHVFNFKIFDDLY